MGDSGSLALGGAMVAFALFTRTELLLLVIALIPVLEVFSVIVQKFVFKTSRKRSVAAGGEAPARAPLLPYDPLPPPHGEGRRQR